MDSYYIKGNALTMGGWLRWFGSKEVAGSGSYPYTSTLVPSWGFRPDEGTLPL